MTAAKAQTLATFHVEVGVGRPAKLEVNGQDVSDVVAEVQFRSSGHDVPELWVKQMPGSVEVEGNGIVRVAATTEAQARDIIVEFLSHIDAGTLERDSLEGVSMKTSPTRAILDTLIDYAKGGTD